MQESRIYEREDWIKAATLLQLIEDQEYSARSENASRPDLKTGADEQVDGVEAEEVYGGEG